MTQAGAGALLAANVGADRPLPSPVCRPATRHGLDPDRVAALIEQHRGVQVTDPGDVQLDVRPLRGGLESAVSLVRADYPDCGGRRRTFRFVAKRLEGETRREAAVYAALQPTRAHQLAPRLLGVSWIDAPPDEPGAPVAHLYLECVISHRRWPWTEVDATATVVDQLAVLHESVPVASLAKHGAEWAYDAELAGSAQSTVELLDLATHQPGLVHLRRHLRSCRQVVTALPAVRRQMLGAPPFGIAVIHGDCHPGNAMIRASLNGHRTAGVLAGAASCGAAGGTLPDGGRSGGLDGPAQRSAVLLDWARARAGSPMEDLASWLQSLGYWEPEARRRHDTFLRRYLQARGFSDRLSWEVRDAYWLAAACNVLSGALRYHLAVATGWGAPPRRAVAEAARAAGDCLRIVRRAAARWQA